MQLTGRAKKVTIFVGHPAGEPGGAPYVRILERLPTALRQLGATSVAEVIGTLAQ